MLPTSLDGRRNYITPIQQIRNRYLSEISHNVLNGLFGIIFSDNRFVVERIANIKFGNTIIIEDGFGLKVNSVIATIWVRMF